MLEFVLNRCVASFGSCQLSTLRFQFPRPQISKPKSLNPKLCAAMLPSQSPKPYTLKTPNPNPKPCAAMLPFSSCTSHRPFSSSKPLQTSAAVAVQGPGFEVKSLGCKVKGLGLEFTVWASGFKAKRRVYQESQLPIIIGNFPLISYYFGLK